MTMLLLGLVLFLGVHSTRIFAEGWRTQMRKQLGENGWKGLYSLLSIAGFALLVWGYGQAGLEPVLLFGAFLLWAVLNFRAARGRDRAAGTVYPAGRTGPTLLTAGIGLLAWAGFAFWAHGALIGVRPFG